MKQTKLRKKLLFIIGTRPEAVKLCPLILRAKARNVFETEVLFTGQHKDMATPVMEYFGVKYDFSFSLNRSDGTLSELTSVLCGEFGRFFADKKYDAVIVQGDTASAFFGALYAFFSKIPVIHIEAGLRTGNIYSPFPEEAYRKFIACIASLHFAPNDIAAENLRKEGITKNVYEVGNIVTDAFPYTLKENPIYEKYRYVIVTLHRRENQGERMKKILGTVISVMRKNRGLKFIFPVHPSESVGGDIRKYVGPEPNAVLVPPFGVSQFHNLLYNSLLVITDSGGVQEEGAAMGVPVIVARDTTERVREEKDGKIYLAGDDCEKIAALFDNVAKKEQKGIGRSKIFYPSVSDRIIDAITEFFS